MKQFRKAFLVAILATAACSPTGGHITATDDKPVKDDSGTSLLPTSSTISLDGGVQGNGQGCAGGATPQCAWIGENYSCQCPPVVQVDAGNVPPPETPLPPTVPDAAVTTAPPVLPDASLPEFPTFHPVTPSDASQPDAPLPVIPPQPTAEPDAATPTYVFPTFPKPETPDAKIVTNDPEPDARPMPDTKIPEDTKPIIKRDCGCEDPTPPVIVVDASVPDTTPPVIVPDAGIDIMPDLLPDLLPDLQPDTTPDTVPDTKPHPDACVSVVSITIEATQITCGTVIDWKVKGCSPSGYKVVWSTNPDPTYPERDGDHHHYISDPNTTSNEIKYNESGSSGTIFVRVCEYVNGVCGVYSNELTIQLGK